MRQTYKPKTRTQGIIPWLGALAGAGMIYGTVFLGVKELAEDDYSDVKEPIQERTIDGRLIFPEFEINKNHPSLNYPLEPAIPKNDLITRTEQLKPTNKDLENKLKKETKVTTLTYAPRIEKEVLAEMIYGEARGEPQEEQIAVAYTALNRLNDRDKRFGKSLVEIIKKPNQYSCFNSNDPNKKKIEQAPYRDPETWDKCLGVAEGVLDGFYENPIGSSTHYVTKEFRKNAPKNHWSRHMKDMVMIPNGEHFFGKAM